MHCTRTSSATATRALHGARGKRSRRASPRQQPHLWPAAAGQDGDDWEENDHRVHRPEQHVVVEESGQTLHRFLQRRLLSCLLGGGREGGKQGYGVVKLGATLIRFRQIGHKFIRKQSACDGEVFNLELNAGMPEHLRAENSPTKSSYGQDLFASERWAPRSAVSGAGGHARYRHSRSRPCQRLLPDFSAPSDAPSCRSL